MGKMSFHNLCLSQCHAGRGFQTANGFLTGLIIHKLGLVKVGRVYRRLVAHSNLFTSCYLEKIDFQALASTHETWPTDPKNGLSFLILGPLKPLKLHMKFGILNFACQTKNSGRWLRPACCSRLAWAISRNFLFGMQNSESRTSKCSPHPPKAPNPKKKAIFVISIKFWISRCQNLKIDIFQKAWSKMPRVRRPGVTLKLKTEYLDFRQCPRKGREEEE